MIRHLVLFRFRDELDTAQVADAVAAFRALQTQIPVVRAFEDGPNLSPEGLAQGFSHAFLLDFDDVAGRDAYLHHPAHQAFVRFIQPRIDQALVFDWRTP